MTRCFPHVVNIAVQTVVKELKENPYEPVLESCTSASGPDKNLLLYADAVRSQPIGTTRDIVAVCRKSGHRRVELQQIIDTGNKSLAWDREIRMVQLLRDCETRWSSTFNMIDRVIELYPVCRCNGSRLSCPDLCFCLQPVEHFLSQPSMSEFTHHLFKPKAYEVLHHIHQMLEIPHRCQELLSAEKTPTLSLVLPTYEMLVVLWGQLSHAIPELSHYIRLGIGKIMEYMSKGRRSRIYALAMRKSLLALLNCRAYSHQSSIPRQSSSGCVTTGSQTSALMRSVGWKKR